MIRAAKINSLDPHPHQHSLKICRVFNGEKEIRVVCGAENVKVGMVGLLAEIGDALPSGRTLGKVNLGGVESLGMLCSAADLGVSTERGIVDLPPHIEIGTPLENVGAEFLSSIPWHSYKEVESFYWNKKDRRIVVVRRGQKAPEDLTLISQTYFHDGGYLYRRYCNSEMIF